MAGIRIDTREGLVHVCCNSDAHPNAAPHIVHSFLPLHLSDIITEHPASLDNSVDTECGCGCGCACVQDPRMVSFLVPVSVDLGVLMDGAHEVRLVQVVDPATVQSSTGTMWANPRATLAVDYNTERGVMERIKGVSAPYASSSVRDGGMCLEVPAQDYVQYVGDTREWQVQQGEEYRTYAAGEGMDYTVDGCGNGNGNGMECVVGGGACPMDVDGAGMVKEEGELGVLLNEQLGREAESVEEEEEEGEKNMVDFNEIMEKALIDGETTSGKLGEREYGTLGVSQHKKSGRCVTCGNQVGLWVDVR